MEIEKLTNCPNCGGILDESGRCKFCGSKVYDFLTLNFSNQYSRGEKNYIRLIVGNKISIIPVYAVEANADFHYTPSFYTYYDGEYIPLSHANPDMTLTVTFLSDGKCMIYEEAKE